MKILHVGKYYPPVPGGMERVLQLLCEGERREVDSRVLVASTGRTTCHEVRNGVPITRAGSLAMIGSVGLSPALPLELRRLGPDLTVVHEPNPIALVSDFLTGQRGPLVVYFHSEVVRAEWKYRLLYRPFLAARPRSRGAHHRGVAEHGGARRAARGSSPQVRCHPIRDRHRATRRHARRFSPRRGRPRRSAERRSCSLSGGWSRTKASTCCSARWRRLTRSLVVVGDGPLRGALEAPGARDVRRPRHLCRQRLTKPSSRRCTTPATSSCCHR